MKKQTLLFIAAFAVLGACSRTENGDVVVKKPVDVDIKTAQDTLHPPVVGTKAETLIVKKPVVGTQKTEVKVPVVKKRPE